MHQPVEQKNPIYFIRMVTGEDVLTEYEKKSKNIKDMVFFHNPMKILYGLTPKQDGMIISLAQWVFDSICEKQEFSIKEADILMIAEPTKEMIEYYQEALDRNAGKKRNIQHMTRKEIDSMEDDYEEISEDEIEMIKNVLGEMKDINRKKLH